MKLFCSLLLALLLISCGENSDKNKPSKNTETAVDSTKSSSQEITDPEETEVWEPEPEIVSFTENGVPSDAIILFDGKNLDAWKSIKDSVSNAPWLINTDGTMTVSAGSGDIKTKEDFGSIQLHLEWRAPQEIVGDSQERGNSGIFFQDKYELQILDSYDNRTYANGQASAIYKQHAPLVNATKPTNQWQTYDVIYHQPEFDAAGIKTKSGTFTVLENGVLVQDDVEILGTTEYIGQPKNIAHDKGPLKLQDHGNPVSYRNIWVRKL